MAVTTSGTVDAVRTVLATSMGELTVVREGEVVTGLYFPRHWPRPDRAAFGPRSDEAIACSGGAVRQTRRETGVGRLA